MPFQQLSTGSIYYQDVGAGRPILLLHGNPGTHHYWVRQVNHLAGRYRVLTLDMRGYGQSDKPEGADYSVFALAQDLREFLDSLELQQVVLGGLSMGSMVALAFALEQQERLQGLILAGTTSDRRDRDPVQNLRELEELGLESYLRRLVNSWFTPHSSQVMVEWTLEEALTTEYHVRAATVRALPSFHVTEKLPEIRVPTLVIAGELDTISTLSHATKVARGVRRGELLVIPDTAHMAILERHAEVNAAVDSFLRRIGY